jgi:hypothetical protein
MQMRDTASRNGKRGIDFKRNPMPSAQFAEFPGWYRSGEPKGKACERAAARPGLLKSMVFPMCRPTFPAPPRRVMALFD